MQRFGVRAGWVLLTLMTVQAGAVADEPEKLVREFVAAFNAHDVDRMLTMCAADVRWMNLAEDKLTVETSGAEKLAESMRAYFRNVPSARSELRGVVTSGSFVTAVERAIWESKGQTRTQCSVSVYEVRDGKVQRVWYYPAHGC